MYNEELKLRGAIVFFDPTLGVGDGQQQSGEVIVYTSALYVNCEHVAKNKGCSLCTLLLP